MKRFFLVLMCGLALSACGGESESKPKTYSVTYSVSGVNTNSASLTYQNSGGGTSQEVVTLPWSKVIIAKPGDFLYVSAQNKNGVGSVTSTITVDKTVFKISTSTGAYVIATATGTCC